MVLHRIIIDVRERKKAMCSLITWKVTCLRDSRHIDIFTRRRIRTAAWLTLNSIIDNYPTSEPELEFRWSRCAKFTMTGLRERVKSQGDILSRHGGDNSIISINPEERMIWVNLIHSLPRMQIPFRVLHLCWSPYCQSWFFYKLSRVLKII